MDDPTDSGSSNSDHHRTWEPIPHHGSRLTTLLSRRGALKYSVSSVALTALGGAAGIAAPPKSLADGLRFGAVDVTYHGATGDGTTDDTASFHAARNAAGVGGRVVVPAGTYAVSGLTASVEDQTWDLSDGAVIRMKVGAAAALLITGDGVSVVGGVFDSANGALHDWSQNGIKIAAHAVTIRNVRVQNSPAFGICAFNRNHIAISGCTLIDNYYGGIFVQNSLAEPSNIYNISITDNLVRSATGQEASGIAVRGDSVNQLVNRVTVSRNTVRLPYNQTGETGGISVTSGADWVVQNNVVSGGFLGITCPNSSRAIISDNAIHGFSAVGVEIPGFADSVTVTRNLIDPDGTSAASGVQASAGVVSDVRVVHNIIRNFSEDCYLISFSSGSISQRIAVSGNILTSAVRSGTFSAIYFNGSVTGLSISGNLVDGASAPRSSGVQFLKSVSEASINANIFANLSDAAILLKASESSDKLDYINAAGNVVFNCGATLKDSTTSGAVVGANIVS